MRLFYFFVGTLSIVIGVLGIVLPVLPTTPFLLLSGFCFAKSSKKFEEKLRNSSLYQKYVSDYAETKRIPKERKKQIYLRIVLLMTLSIILAPLWQVKVALIVLLIFITYYLFKKIPE